MYRLCVLVFLFVVLSLTECSTWNTNPLVCSGIRSTFSCTLCLGERSFRQSDGLFLCESAAPTQQSKGNTVPAIAGAVGGFVVFVVALLVALRWRRRRQNVQSDQNDPNLNADASPTITNPMYTLTPPVNVEDGYVVNTSATPTSGGLTAIMRGKDENGYEVSHPVGPQYEAIDYEQLHGIPSGGEQAPCTTAFP